jgi:hypothetical protein
MDEVMLRSGRWAYSLVTVKDMPEGGPLVSHVFFHLADDPSSIMWLCVSGTLDEHTDFGELAWEPDSREVVFEGQRWIFHPVSRDGRLRTVVFMSADGGLGAEILPKGVSLANATNGELRRAVESGRIR